MSVNARLETVAEEMERAFRPLAGRTPPPTARRQPLVPRRRSHRSRWLLVAAPVLVLASGAWIGLDAMRGQSEARPISSRPAVRSAAVADAPLPVRPAIPEAIVPPIDAEPAIATVAMRDEDRGERLDRVAARRDRASPPPRATKPAALPSRADVEAPGENAPLEQAPRFARIGATRDAASRDCGPNSLEDRCIYQDVLDADSRLRRAYSRARRLGVASDELTGIGRRWRQARELASYDPDGTIRRYDRLTGELDGLQQEVGE